MNISGITKKYDDLLLQAEHYKKYPNMLPWVGQFYGEKYKKVVFIGESHYLPDYSVVQQNVDRWYSSTQSALDDFELSYINTRGALFKHHQRNGIWRIPAKLMIENGIELPETSNNLYEHFCFYNFFQRPAEVEGKEIHISKKDTVEANKVFLTNLSILRPEIIVFFSSKAWNNSDKNSDEISFHFTPHPSSPWWNRNSRRYALEGSGALTGKEKFTRLIQCFKHNTHTPQ